MTGGLGGGLEAGQTSVAPSKGTATGGDEPDKVVLSRDQLRVDRERHGLADVVSTPEHPLRRRGRMR